jgi:hypothetical protein
MHIERGDFDGSKQRRIDTESYGVIDIAVRQLHDEYSAPLH